jgi:hypothetical protein
VLYLRRIAWLKQGYFSSMQPILLLFNHLKTTFYAKKTHFFAVGVRVIADGQ